MAVTILVVLPGQEVDSGELLRNLPFGLGPVDPNVFNIITFFILAVLAIAFCQAYAQSIRVHRLAHQTIKTLNTAETDVFVGARDFYDFFIVSTLTRVAPLPQLLFVGKNRSAVYNYLCMVYYLFLKLVVALIIFALPATALWFGFQSSFDNQSVATWVVYLAQISGVLALLALAQVGFEDLRSILKVARLFKHGAL